MPRIVHIFKIIFIFSFVLLTLAKIHGEDTHKQKIPVNIGDSMTSEKEELLGEFTAAQSYTSGACSFLYCSISELSSGPTSSSKFLSGIKLSFILYAFSSL